MLWYPVGYTAGYLVLLVLRRGPAAPLRRVHAPRLRRGPARVAGRARGSPVLFVVGVGWLYLLPQLQGAGLTLEILTGAPNWVGGLVVAVVVIGGRRRGRHAQHHLRTGLPVLAQAHRPAGARALPGRSPGRATTRPGAPSTRRPRSASTPSSRIDDGLDRRARRAADASPSTGHGRRRARTRTQRVRSRPAHAPHRGRAPGWPSRRAPQCPSRAPRHRRPAGPSRSSGGPRRAPAVRHVRTDPRHLPRHDGAAARRRPLLHQPARRRRPPHHRSSCSG